MSQDRNEPSAPEPAEPAAPAATVSLTDDLPGAIEALLLTTDRALPESKIKDVLGKVASKDLAAAIAQLNKVYEETGRSFRIEQVAGGWQILTLPKYSAVLGALHRSRAQMKLSPAALETLAIVAYKQPVSRAQIASIRGVSVEGVLRTLCQRGYVTEVGRDPGPGQAVLYGTTPLLLERLGLDSVRDLPPLGDFVPGPEVMDALEQGLHPGG